MVIPVNVALMEIMVEMVSMVLPVLPVDKVQLDHVVSSAHQDCVLIYIINNRNLG